MYYSNTKNKYMEPKDMHMMHLENVLLKDIREDNLGWTLTNRLTEAYIAKSKEDREKLHGMVKNAVGVNRLLIDLIAMPRMGGFLKKPVTPKAKPSTGQPTHVGQLALYRNVALQYVGQHGYISADTLRRVLSARGHNVNGQTLQHVFRDARFVQAGYRRSQWDGAKGRFINTWKAA